jgi:hypothetical protein
MPNPNPSPPSTSPEPSAIPPLVPPKVVSLLDLMKDGSEYASLVASGTGVAADIASDLRKAIAEIEAIRKRPLICYAGNIVRAGSAFTSIELADDLPFSELVDSVDKNEKQIDLMIATPGGSGQQVHNFVCKLRPRFDHVAFLIPHMAMSAGTIWALSGNDLIMDSRGFLGPIDPQVPNRDGRWVPAQALSTLIKQIQEEGAKALKGGSQPEWASLQLLKHIDAKELGDSISATKYGIQLASIYLSTYKFSDWKNHKNGTPVTQTERESRALTIATQLSSHDEWKAHSHGIFRDVLWDKCRIKITHAESIPGLERALRRLWAILYFAFEGSDIQKIYFSQKYPLFRLRSK